MILPRPVAWLILGLAFFTAGLLRQHHDQTPTSPYVPPVVGSLLFAAILLLLLLAFRERRLGVVRERGVRLGSLTPILLMLLVEKWFSLSLYGPVFSWTLNPATPEPELDARYRAFTAMGLLAVCVLMGAAFRPAGRRTWKRTAPARWPIAIVGTTVVVAGAYLLLSGVSRAMGGELTLAWPSTDRLWLWIVGGQTVRAFAEELYYRGFLLAEMERLAPRLGVRGATARRWTALIPTAALFAMEHITIAPPWGRMEREAIFTLSLGLLLGILVLVTVNLPFATGVHAYVNWLLLGAAPRFVDSARESALPAGTYVGIALILAFVLSFLRQKAGRSES